MASINKTPTGKWKVRIRAHGESFSKTFASRKAALTWAKRKEWEMEFGEARAQEESPLQGVTLSEVITVYLSEWRGKDTAKAARLGWWDEHLGRVPILDINKVQIREALRKYAAGNAAYRTHDGVVHDTGRKRSGGTVNRLMSALSAVFEWGRYELDLPSNPCREVRGRSESKNRERFLSREEVADLLQACRQSSWDKLYLLVLMALNTCGRRGELMGLHWNHIDWQNRTAMLYDTKNEERRVLPLSPEVMEELQRYRPGAGKVVPLAQTSLMGDTLIFCGIRPMVKRAFDAEWHAALERAGLEGVRFHDLRHTGASWLGMAGRSLHEIGNVLGHKNLATTQRYAHFCVESKRALTDSVLGNLANGGNADE